MPATPYDGLPSSAFWRSGVAERPQGQFGGFYSPRFRMEKTIKIATAGSCFAQHVGRALRDAGFAVIDAEPPPTFVPSDILKAYGFDLYSARYGNIYTARQLFQLWRESRGGFSPALSVWEKDGRFYDAQRPAIEPGGFDSPEAVLAHRALHLTAVRRAFSQAEVFVFTFGLTETWEHIESGTVYPTCPGTLAGAFDPRVFRFLNLGFADVLSDFTKFRKAMMTVNPDVRFLVTVSPVPLTATASGQHVEVATAHSKAVLRAVCGQLMADYDNVDYFPSYEIITSQRNGAAYFKENLREVTSEGVATAMRTFLAAHLGQESLTSESNSPATPPPGQALSDDAEALVCEEALLEAFRK